MQQIRCFVAIELEEDMRQALHQTQALLKAAPAGQYCRWVRPEGIHLTLKFLGDVPENRIDSIAEAIREAAAEHPCFGISFASLGCFPNARLPRVTWVGVEDPGGALQSLQRSVESSLSALGYPPEKRAFHPHLTLARTKRVTRREQAAVGELVQRTRIDQLGEMEVREISLMRSELRPSGSVYTRLAAGPLDDQARRSA
jgi:2'-5' RNA ligase